MMVATRLVALAEESRVLKTFDRAIPTPDHRNLAIIAPLSCYFLAMNQPIKRDWLDPFRRQPEMEALD